MTHQTGLTVVKLGGSLIDDAQARGAVLDQLVARWRGGEELILVHGGGKQIDRRLAALGIPKATHAGLRVTDDATLDIVISVLAGSVNKAIVAELARRSVRAAGISGCDGSTLIAARHPLIDGVDLGNVGVVTGSNRMLLRAMLTSGILPVVSSIAEGPDGALLNVNADAAAAAIAAAHGARELLFLTDVPGLLDTTGSVVPHLDAEELDRMLASPAVSGGMRPKLLAALSALQRGVARIAIGAPASDGVNLTTGGTELVAA